MSGSDPAAVDGAVACVQDVTGSAWEFSIPKWQSPPSESLRNRTRLARRAEAWMVEHLAEPVGVPDLCLALRVSRRELEYAFRTAFDQSPRKHLQALRLNAISRVLQRAKAEQTTVIQVALDYGITHLSRFAAEYSKLFGELPSATLRS